jgi:hypothetical protein
MRKLNGTSRQGRACSILQRRPHGRRVESRWRYQAGDAALHLPRRRLGPASETVTEMGVRNYIAIAEPSDDGKTWWISFPGFPGATSAMESGAV